MSDNIRGWEILYNHYKGDLKNKLDLVVLVLHFCLTKHGFRSVRVKVDNEMVTSATHGPGSETLPPNWNSVVEANYILDYIYENRHYRLRCSSAAGNYIFNLIELADDHRVTSVLINPEVSVTTLDGSVFIVLPQLEKTVQKILKEFVFPLISKGTQDMGTQTNKDKEKEKSKQRVSLPGTSGFPHHYDRQPPLPLGVGYPDINRPGPSVGSSDLFPYPQGPTPFGGGGMIFDPFHQGLPYAGGPAPPGYVPNARFDPIGPTPPRPLGPYDPRAGPRGPAPRLPGSPDPDHMPPPGYEDMFM